LKDPAKTPAWLDYIDHTGDAGILVRGQDLRQLFARAAWGMFSILTNMDTIRVREKIHIRVEANDLAALMLAWLSELNYRHMTEHWLIGKFEVSAHKTDDAGQGIPSAARKCLATCG
jgi:protein archease